MDIADVSWKKAISTGNSYFIRTEWSHNIERDESRNTSMLSNTNGTRKNAFVLVISPMHRVRQKLSILHFGHFLFTLYERILVGKMFNIILQYTPHRPLNIVPFKTNSYECQNKLHFQNVLH